MSEAGERTVLVTGAGGFVGGRLAPALAHDGFSVRATVRDPGRAPTLPGCEVVPLELCGSDAELDRALEGVELAYFLVHMMGRVDDYAEREAAAARRFAGRAAAAGVERVVYLGGLGDPGVSSHLRSRHATAAALIESGPPLTYFKAAMVIGARSESYVLLRSIVDRLIAIPRSEWLERRSQPIGIRDVLAYLRATPTVAASAGRAVEIGGPDVLSHRETVGELARQLGRRPPRTLPIPGATPGAIAAAATAVTRGDPPIARELVYGLATDSIVGDPTGMELFEIEPERVSVAMQRAIEEEEMMGRR